MAKTTVSDVIVPDVFNPYVVERTAELSALYQSGIISTNPELNRLAEAGGRLINMPYWEDLDGEDEILKDDEALGVDKITASKDVAALLMRGKAWSANDLAKALSGDDPMAAIGDLVAQYWARRWQKILISTLTGIFAATGQFSGNDHLSETNMHDIGDAGDDSDSKKIDAEAAIDAVHKLGDAYDRLTAFAMHSAVVAKLAKDDLIDYIKPSEGLAEVPTFQGKRVIVDDGCPVNTSGTHNVYDTYIFGEGAIGYGEGGAPVPTETDRDSLAGDDILINRRHFILHPRGVRFMDQVVTDESPTNGELEEATNWQRVYEPKNCRIVLFRHNI